MNKTIVTCCAITCLTFLTAYSFTINIYKQIALRTETKNSTQRGNETRDRFTVCMQTVMSEARQSGKPIDATEAKGICSSVEKV